MNSSEFIKKFFQYLDEVEIAYCILRNYEGLPDSFSHDIDIQIELGKMNEFVKALLAFCDKTNWFCVRFDNRQGYHFFNLTNGSDVMPLDVWMPMMYKSCMIICPKETIRTRKRYKGLWVASGGIEVANSLLKEVLYVGKVKDKGDGEDKKRYQKLLLEDEGIFVRSICEYIGEGLSQKLYDLVLKGDWKEIERLRNDLFKVIYSSNMKNRYIDRIKSLVMHLKDRLFLASHLKICFIGPDGSGKTSALKKFKDFSSKLFNGVSDMHGHFLILPELNKIKSMFRKRSHVNEIEKIELDRKVKSKSPSLIMIWIYLIYYTLDYVLGHFQIVKKKVGHVGAHLFLWDRYYYDYIIHKDYYGIPMSLHWLIIKLIPRPDILIFLHCDPRIIFERKPELNIEDIDGQQKRCYLLIDQLKGNVIETEKGVDISNGEIINLFINYSSIRALDKLKSKYLID